MNNLIAWLKIQHSGLRTFRGLKARLDALADNDCTNRAIYRLVGAPVENYLSAFEHEITGSDTADEAFRRVVDLVQKADVALRASSEERFILMNELAGAELY